jgi:hypothetical protein
MYIVLQYSSLQRLFVVLLLSHSRANINSNSFSGIKSVAFCASCLINYLVANSSFVMVLSDHALRKWYVRH